MIKKEMLDGKNTCKVTFTLDNGSVSEAKRVSLVGEFNDWDPSADPMKRTKGGGFSKSVKLDCGDRYQFRYVIDDSIWANDAEADDYVPSPFGCDNSVVDVPVEEVAP
jgi:1,4-alpha-glucan branching enzyme